MQDQCSLVVNWTLHRTDAESQSSICGLGTVQVLGRSFELNLNSEELISGQFTGLFAGVRKLRMIVNRGSHIQGRRGIVDNSTWD